MPPLSESVGRGGVVRALLGFGAMSVQEQAMGYALDLGRWVAMLESAASNCRWMLGITDPPLSPGVQARVTERLETAERMAELCRQEKAMWLMMAAAPPAPLVLTSRGERSMRQALARWERDVVS